MAYPKSLRRAYDMVGEDLRKRLLAVQKRKAQIVAEIKNIDFENQSLSLRLALLDAVEAGDMDQVAAIATKALDAIEIQASPVTPHC